MHFISSSLKFVALLSLLSPVSASQTPAVSTVKLTRRKEGNVLQRHVKRLSQLSLPLPSNISILDEQVDTLYGLTVFLGEQRQPMNIQLDTGSSDCWFRGPQCTNPSNDGSCNGTVVSLNDAAIIPIMNTSSSSIASFTINYALGNTTALIFNAPVLLGPYNVTLPIGVSTVENSGAGIDGIIGLAGEWLSSIAYSLQTSNISNASTSFFDGIGFPQSEKKFGMYLSNAKDSDPSAEMTFGGYDDARYKGEINWFAVDMFIPSSFVNNTLSWWVFKLLDASVTVQDEWSHKVLLSSFPLANSSTNLTDTIADSGTSLMMLGHESAVRINAALNGTYNSTYQLWTFPDCSVVNSTVTVNIDMGGKRFKIPSSSWVYITQDNNNNTMCVSAFMDGADNSTAIFGDTFLRNYYTFYDQSEKSAPRVGFADAVHTLPPPSLSSSTSIATTTSYTSKSAYQSTTSLAYAPTRVPSISYPSPNPILSNGQGQMKLPTDIIFFLLFLSL